MQAKLNKLVGLQPRIDELAWECSIKILSFFDIGSGYVHFLFPNSLLVILLQFAKVFLDATQPNCA